MKNILSLLMMAFLFGCSTNKLNLQPVKELDLNKYSGTWYEIARLPNSFEEGLKCVTANYTIKPNGKVRVINKGHEIGNSEKVSVAKGTAKVPDPDEPGKLKVTFFWPFYGNYWVLKLDPNYRYVVVGEPSGDYLWILSRTPSMTGKRLNELIAFARNEGFNTKNLEFVKQDCNPDE